eukprot:3370662-Rhodomonas_salina.4
MTRIEIDSWDGFWQSGCRFWNGSLSTRIATEATRSRAASGCSQTFLSSSAPSMSTSMSQVGVWSLT